MASVPGANHPVFQPQQVDRPVPGTIIGGFGVTTDPVLRVPVLRNGVELRARRRDEVRAVAAGHVAFAGPLPGLGDVVVIDHGAGWLSLTGRLLVAAVDVGDVVGAGTVLGQPQRPTPNDGLGTTVYLELRHGERPVDPTPLLRPSP
jgi:septal ring factor EnvC (AmiA/AmiB activator)